ncbi:MAG: hypothetical protein ACLRSW_16215 [Christensenellaceae bacterium]
MKKSKILILLSLAAIAAGCALAFAGCKPHSAQNSSSADSASDPVFQWVTDKEATCTEAGSKHKEYLLRRNSRAKIIYPKHIILSETSAGLRTTRAKGSYTIFPATAADIRVGIGSARIKTWLSPLPIKIYL